MEREYQICKRCVMDTSDPDIVFDENGYCNHCTNALKRLNEIYFIDPELKRKKLNEIVTLIKNEGKGRKYDCIIGLSGGVDSSYLAYVVVKELGLRPLAVHVDNGWNSELAVMNIENIVNKLGIDLITVVLDWEEFREIQLAFLKSSVIDLELTSDFAIFSSIQRVAKKNKLKYFLIGSNIATESIMPKKWFYPYKLDYLNIKDIVKNNCTIKLHSFPKINFFEYLFYSKMGVKNVSILNYILYDKKNAKEIIKNELNWRDYGSKHEESTITAFYQKYILLQKYNVDKRRAHFSSLICVGQITREQAENELKKAVYNDTQILSDEIEYFCKKMCITKQEFDKLMKEKRVEHSEYRSYQKYKEHILNIFGKN